MAYTIQLFGEYAVDIYNPQLLPKYSDKWWKVFETTAALFHIITITLFALALYSLTYGRVWSHKTSLSILTVLLGDKIFGGTLYTIRELYYAFREREPSSDDERESLLNPESDQER